MTYRKSTTVRQFALSTSLMKENWNIQKVKLKKQQGKISRASKNDLKSL